MAKRKEFTFERLQKGKQLSSRERKELERRLISVDPGFETVHPHAAGAG